MFGKLMKYELRYLLRIFGPMWGLVLALCIAGRLSNWDLTNMETNTVFALLMMAAVIAIVAMMVIGAVVLIQRFYKGMYGDEGYLMFTLPVKTGALINAKALSALLMLFVTGVVTVAGYLILFSYEEIWTELVDFVEVVMSDPAVTITGLQVGLICFWGLVAMAASMAQELYCVYLSISVGQLWRKHPVAGGILAYYGIGVVFAMVGEFLYRITGEQLFDWMDSMTWITELQDYRLVILLFVGSAVLNLILGGLFFLGTKVLMDKKLNIQ